MAVVMKSWRLEKIASLKPKRRYKKLLTDIDNIGSFAYNILSLITSEISGL